MKISKKRFEQILMEEFNRVIEAEKNYNTTQWRDNEGNYYSMNQNADKKWNIIKYEQGNLDRPEVLKDQDGTPLSFPDDGAAAVYLDTKGNREDKINTF